MGSIPAGNVREGYKPCKKRDDTTRVSSLTNEESYLFLYLAPARDEEDRRSSSCAWIVARRVFIGRQPAMKKTEGLRIRRCRARLVFIRRQPATKKAEGLRVVRGLKVIHIY